MPATRWRRTSFILMAALAAIWVSVATREAAHRPLWLDEVYGLDQSIRNVSFAQLFINGALGQGSPSPLDYVLVKCLDRVRSEVRYLGLEPHVYFRLIAMLSTLIAGVCAFQMAMRPGGREATGRARALVTVLAVCAMLSLVLDPMIFHFAGEVRPYALWTACWFLAAGSFLWQGRNARGWQFVLLVALSLTATASVFQLVALGAASSSVELASGKTLANVVEVPPILGFACVGRRAIAHGGCSVPDRSTYRHAGNTSAGDAHPLPHGSFCVLGDRGKGVLLH